MYEAKKDLFVRQLGRLLSMTREGIAEAEYEKSYDFEDKMEHQSSSKPASSEPASKEDSPKKYDWPSVILGTLAFGVYIFFMFVLPFIMS